MSTSGPDEELLGGHRPRAGAAADVHLRVERDQRRGGVRRVDRHAAARPEDAVLAIHRRGRVGVADVAAGAVAVPAVAVVPAPRVLHQVPAQRPLVADLRRRHQLRRLGQQPVLAAHVRVPDDLAQLRHRPDRQAAARRRANGAQLLDAPEVDHRRRPLDPILEPVERIEPARQHPGLLLVLIEQPQRLVGRRRLKQLKRRHHVANHGHLVSPSADSIRRAPPDSRRPEAGSRSSSGSCRS